LVINITSEQGASVGRPGERDTSWVGFLFLLASSGVLVEVDVGRVELGDDLLVDQIPDLDTLLGSSAEPVSVGAESKRVDDVSSVGEGRDELAFVEIPQFGNSVFATRSAKRTIRGNSDGVNVVSVSAEGGAKLAVAQAPDLDLLVPATRYNQWVGSVW